MNQHTPITVDDGITWTCAHCADSSTLSSWPCPAVMATTSTRQAVPAR